ncbi:hypothetical protein [Nitrosovibrio sp. Nv6]|uniref:hypothetical protein n=1 Tax=Nitrosovibrio sp. Nv6 TaxID=1855340 RepID=UPI000B87929A|nr:hypothetical protein [Nitrosovibrio sp. Nv6]
MDLFSWLLKQPQEEVLDLLTLCVSSSVDTLSDRENAIPPEVPRMMNALDTDMTDCWKSTGESYLSHVSKERILGGHI